MLSSPLSGQVYPVPIIEPIDLPWIEHGYKLDSLPRDRQELNQRIGISENRPVIYIFRIYGCRGNCIAETITGLVPPRLDYRTIVRVQRSREDTARVKLPRDVQSLRKVYFERTKDARISRER